MPTNLYGINDNFDLKSSHVLPALIRKFHEAKISKCESVQVWGSGNPKREFLYVDDLADACVFLMKNINAEQLYENLKISHLNVGCGEDVTISQLANIISKTVDFKGNIEYDRSKPDGTPRKLLNVSKLTDLGWSASTNLEDGINKTYQWFINHKV